MKTNLLKINLIIVLHLLLRVAQTLVTTLVTFLKKFSFNTKSKHQHTVTHKFSLTTLITAVVLFFGLTVDGFGQVKNYVFSSATGTYTAITGGTQLSTAAAMATDTNYSVTIPTFRFNGVDYTQIYVNNNGYITFGATAPTAANYSPISATTAFGGAVTGWSSVNLIASTVAGASAEVRWQQVGSDVVIQFKDLARTAAADRMNFQIILTPGAAGVNGSVKIIYGTFTTTSTSITAANAGVIGIRGASNTEFHTRAVYGTAPYNTWASSGGAGDNGATKINAATTNTVSLNCVRWTTTIFPATGLTYSWNPVSSGFYQSLPYTQNFDSATWTSSQATEDVPSATGVTNWPASGHNSWRNITATAANALWSGTTGRFAAPTTQAGLGAAQFNQYNCITGAKGNLDFYLNFSSTGQKAATFYVRNPGTATANDVLNVYLSTNGGVSFTLLQSYAAPIASWTQQTLSLSASTNTNCILRFEGVSDYGNAAEDLAIDELNVSVPRPSCAATPTPTTGATAIAQLPTLSWPAVSGATGYDIYLGTTSGTTTIVSTNQAGTTYSPALLDASTTYYWIVIPVNTYGNRATGCSEWSFTTSAPTPTLSVSTLTAFANQCINKPSSANSFTVSGIYLSSDVNIAALTGYAYSLTSNGTYTSTLTIPASGTLASTTVYVQFTPTSATAFTGNIVASSTDATSQNVAASGTGINTAATATTGITSNLTSSSVTAAGSYVANCQTITAYGIEYSTTNGFANGAGTQVTSTNQVTSSFTASLTGLSGNTIYYYKAYATYGGTTVYGTQSSFTTLVTPPNNDGCLSATSLPCATSSLAGTTVASVSETAPLSYSSPFGVWYTFIGNGNSTTITANAAWDHEVLAFSGTTCGGTYTYVANADGNTSGNESVTFATTNGTQYFIYIAHYSTTGLATNTGTFTISRTCTLPPTITSLGAASGCVGSSLVITGTNFTGATAVTIGGTAATITATTATTVTVTVGSGTTGTIQVTTPGGLATSADSFTVNPVPVITTQPVITSICTNGTGTFSVVATDATTYQWRRAGVDLTDTPPYSGVNTATLTITNPAVADAGNFRVFISNANCSVTSANKALTVLETPSFTTNPSNVSVAGGGTTSFTVAASNTPTSYTWEVSSNGGVSWTTISNSGAYSTATTATLTITGANYGMNGNIYRASATNNCGTSSVSTTASLTIIHCVPTNTTSGDYISSFSTTGGITNANTNSAITSALEDFTSIIISAPPSAALNFNGAYAGGNAGFSIWIDWNSNYIFDGTELMYNASSTSASWSGTFNVPSGQALGDYKMRIRASYNAVSPSSCANISYGQAEDYTFRVITPPTCSAPVSLIGTPTSLTTASISWTEPTSAPSSGYEYYVSTLATPPTSGSTPTGSTAVGIITANLTGLTANTTYYFWVRSNCDVDGTSPWIGSTFYTGYCIPTTTNTTDYTSAFSTTGGITNLSYTATSQPAGSYSNQTAQILQAYIGSTINFSHTYVGGSNGVKIWIDWNNDLTFAATEEMFYIVNSNATNTGSFSIPAGTANGNYRIRVRSDWGSSANPTPCGLLSYGSTVDYTFTAISLSPCSGTPVGGSVTVAPIAGAPGSTYGVTATGLTTTGTGLTYQWQYSDTGAAPWTNQGTATSAYAALSGMVAPAIGIVRTWQLLVTCTSSGISTGSTTGTFTPVMIVPSTGNNSYTTCSGSLYDNGGSTGDYAISSNGYTVINPATVGSFIRVSGSIISEAGYDYLTIYDGVGTAGTILWGGLAHGTGTSCTTFTVPTITSTTGPLTIKFNSDSSSNCAGFNLTISCYTSPPCVAPTAQPTALSLTPSGSSISGSFTAASPASDSYLVVVSTSATPPTAPVNTTSYTIGGTLSAGYTIVDTDTNNAFTATGLTPLTAYYFYIYSFNGLCSGGPVYLGTTPLTGNTTTLAASYCVPTVSSTYQTSTNFHIRKVEFIGTLQDIVNTSSFPTVAPFGYQNHTGLAVKSIQAKGEGVNIYMESPSSGYIKAWVDWNSDGDFADSGETVYDAGGTSQASTTLGFIVPSGISAGDYRVRLRISGRNSASGGIDAGSSWDSCTTNLAYYGETEDYILRVIENCAARIASITNGSVCGTGAVTLSATGTAGTTEYRWYSAQTGGTLLATTATGTWNTPTISITTEYWVTAFNGTCETLVRSNIKATVKPVPTLSFATSNTEVCGENSIVVLTASGDNEVIHLLDENFESGLGTFSNVHYVSNATKNTETAWQIKTSAFVPSGSGATWYPAIQSNFGANNFAFTTSDIGTVSASTYYTVDNGLVSNTVNSTGFLSLTFKFRAYFDRYYPNGAYLTDELMTIDVSTNGGTTWLPISGNITSDIGYGTRFTDYSYDLTSYINQSNLKVRIRYYSSTWANGAAIDDIELFGLKPLSTALNWSGTPMPDVYTDAATTVPYIAGTPATTVYVKPALGQLETNNYNFTATATLTNGCAVSQNITIENKSSIWKGTVDTDWNNPNNWSPAVVPTANSCVIIPSLTSNIIGTNYNGFGKTLIIKNGGRLDIQSNNTLTITDGVTVEATGLFKIESSASLIQINNVTNIGNIEYKRTANVRKQDYVYWSSPVASFASNAISPGTGLGFQYKWIPTIATNTNFFGNWAYANETMLLGKGYCVRGPNSFSTTVLANYTASFIGVPNNGIVRFPISRGTYAGANYATGVSSTPGTQEDDNWNLVGNPYPSAIDAVKFLTLNTNIAGFVNIWTHGTLPSNAIIDPFYANYVYNYTPADYITFNAVGGSSGANVFNGKIPGGQGFFISMLHSSAATTEDLVFNNTLRSNTYDNSNFYKNSNENINSEELEKHRIWFDLVAPAGNSIRALIGYVENATNESDRLFDAISNEKLSFNIFSLINEEQLLIQGRKLPFDTTDKVNIGVRIPQDGLYKIALSTVDGLFLNPNQNIYLEDKLLNIIFNLKEAPYSFFASTGTIKDRFVIRYAKESNIKELINQVTVYDNSILNVESGKLKIKDIVIFDTLGKLVFNKKNINQKNYQINNLNRTKSLMIVKVTLEDNTEETTKIIY